MEAPQAERAHTIDPSLLSNKFLRMIADLPKRQASLIFQLHKSHTLPNLHLHQMKCSPSACPRCPNKKGTVPHFLLFCPVYAVQCNTLHKKLNRKASDITALVSNPKCVEPLPSFAHTTGRFPKSPTILWIYNTHPSYSVMPNKRQSPCCKWKTALRVLVGRVVQAEWADQAEWAGQVAIQSTKSSRTGRQGLI